MSQKKIYPSVCAAMFVKKVHIYTIKSSLTLAYYFHEINVKKMLK
jgi:hypothetical protein